MRRAPSRRACGDTRSSRWRPSPPARRPPPARAGPPSPGPRPSPRPPAAGGRRSARDARPGRRATSCRQWGRSPSARTRSARRTRCGSPALGRARSGPRHHPGPERARCRAAKDRLPHQQLEHRRHPVQHGHPFPLHQLDASPASNRSGSTTVPPKAIVATTVEVPNTWKNGTAASPLRLAESHPLPAFERRLHQRAVRQQHPLGLPHRARRVEQGEWRPAVRPVVPRARGVGRAGGAGPAPRGPRTGRSARRSRAPRDRR